MRINYIIFLSVIFMIAISMIAPIETFTLSATIQDGSTEFIEDESSGDPKTWTFIDSSNFSIDVVGEQIGVPQGQSFAGWYTDTIVFDPTSGRIVVAWVRWNVDNYGTDQIYVSIFKPIDTDNDGQPEAYNKIVKLVDDMTSLKSLDSITIGTFDGEKYVLITWTYYDSTYKNNVAGAVYTLDGEYVWGGTIRGTTSYEEYSKSCFVPNYNNGDGGFLIVWFTSYDKSVDGRWLYRLNGIWTLGDRFDIADTNDLYYTKADQMLCIGGNNKALVVYRKWDGIEGKPDLYATLIDSFNNLQEIKLYDYNGAEETVGVRGAYLSNLFLVPLISGTHVRYDIVSEYDGTVYNRDYVTSNGGYPYAIAAYDRFVMVWIDYYNDDDGEPKIANIDTSQLYIHPQYGVSLTGGDSYVDRHPIVVYYLSGTSKKAFVVWSNSTNSEWDVEYAKVSLGSTTDSPVVDETGVLVKDTGNQIACGIGLVSDSQYVVSYIDTSDGEEDLLGYISLPDSEDVLGIDLYELPSEGDSYKDLILNLINNANNEIYLAVAFFRETSPGDEGTISKALVDAKNRGVDVRVIIDNDTDNKPVYEYLKDNGVSIINDSAAVDAEHIMHNKFLVIDQSIIVIGTVNMIPSDFSQNNNTAIYMESKAVAYFYREEFLHMWNNGNGLFGTDKTDDHSFIAFISYNGRTIVFEGYFSPQEYGDKSRIPSVIMGYITRATSSVYFASYIFTTSYYVTPIYNAIVEASKSGKNVIGVFDESMNVDIPGRRFYWFLDNNIPLAIDNHPYKMHAKLFSIDNKTAIMGSWNPTRSATINHDENIILIRDTNNVENGYATQLSGYILKMYNGNNFVRYPYQYNPVHIVLSKVMFKPDETGDPEAEWVELYNPTDSSINLSNYVIGDADDLIHGDRDSDDGLYRFPSTATINPGGFIVIAYNATKFYEEYGFYPTYEIVNTKLDVPDLIKYDSSKYPGEWNLSDSGDEVILAIDSKGFLMVIDAVWYGDSTYMSTSIGRPNSALPVDITDYNAGDALVNKGVNGDSTYVDAIYLDNKWEKIYDPIPVPEPFVGIVALTTIIVFLLTRKLL